VLVSTARRGGWPVVAVNGVVAATVLVLVAVLALVVKPPAPPGIAAFAPQAAKPITKAPQDQSAQFGAGAGQCADGQVCTGPSGRPSPTTPSLGPNGSASLPPLTGAAPAGLQCFEWPDGSVTQTFDPQSPPCISRWDDSRGNGGATSPGVSGSEIRVALPVAKATSNWPTLQPIVDFFNSRFQLYGRKITIVPVHSQQDDQTTSGGWNDPQAQRADAAGISQQRVFASFDFIDPISENWSLPVFLDTLAKHKIVSINGGETTPFDTAAGLAKRAPYAWSYHPTIDQLMKVVATMTCRQLAGKVAQHAPDPALRSKTRKFAVFIPGEERAGGPIPGLSSMLGILDACGIHDPKVVSWQSGRTASTALAASFQQLSRDGVTSVIFFPFGANGTTSSPLVVAQEVGFRPEWVIVGWNNYNTAFMLNDPSTETSGAFGVGIWNKHLQVGAEPWSQAAVAGGGNSSTAALTDGRAFYQEMLLLASGVQMAGPHLTPESFAQGLRSTTFPNPGGGTAPFYQGTADFADGDPVLVSDFNAFWLDTRTSGKEVETSPGINESKAMCEVGLGTRWTESSWPRVDRYYQGPCR
jgi:hypothetical protein